MSSNDELIEDVEAGLAAGKAGEVYAKCVAAIEAGREDATLHYCAARAVGSTDGGKYLHHLQRANAMAPRDVEIGRAYVGALLRNRDKAAASAVAEKYFPFDDPEFKPNQHEIALLRGLKTSPATIDDILTKATTTGRPSPWAINLIAKSLPLEEAKVALDRLPEAGSDAAWSQRRNDFGRILTQLLAIKASLSNDRIPQMEAEISRLSDAGASGEYMVFPRKSANTLLIFTGAQGATGGIPIEKSHWFTANRDANVVYMLNRTFGLRGKYGMSEPNGLDDLRALLRDLGTRNVFVAGFSGGCFAAIRCATQLKARRCAAFNPLTRLDEEGRRDDERFQRHDGGAERLDGFLGEASPVLDDDIAASPQTIIDLYFATDDARTRRQIEYISHYPNVLLHPVAEVEKRGLVAHCMGHGEYAAALDRLFEGRP